MAVRKKSFPVVGMGCAACSARVQGVLKNRNGVSDANVNLAAGMATVEYDTATVKASDLKKAVRDAGYDMIVPEEEDEDSDQSGYEAQEAAEEEARRIKEKEYSALKRDMWFALLLAGAIMLIGMGFKDFPGKGLTLFLLATVSVFGCGRRFIRNALVQLRHFNVTMDTLVALSTFISWLFSTFNLVFPSVWTSKGLSAGLYFDSSAMIIAFILVGKVLEERARFGTTEAVRKLMGLQSRRVKARPGDILRVKPGQRIPVDGVVVDGSSFVDESLLTGEPVAVEKFSGSRVFAGTMNGNGSLGVRAEKTGGDTMLSSIIRMVKDAQGSRARIQNIVDKVASVFVPAIILIALATFMYWVFVPGGGLAKALLTMVSVLVIACPCSLGLATPTAIVAGVGKGAAMGILVKDADALQVAGKIDTVVLDKTGTLTLGKPSVTGEFWYDESAKGLLKSMEALSEHPLAEAVLRALEGVGEVPVDGFRAIPGKGLEAFHEGERLFVGNTAAGESRIGEKWAAEGKTVVYFSGEGRTIAVFAIEDELKPTSAEAVARLDTMGIKTFILTGDNETVAAEVCRKVGAVSYAAAMLPEGKVRYIKDLQEKGHVVAMVGDGINDSAALAQADLSIAMGRGSDIAMDAAMTTIVSSDLLKIPDLVSLSRKSVRIINENLVWAFLYNVLAVPAAAGVMGFSLNPMIAAACMALSSVCVVTNSLRLRR